MKEKFKLPTSFDKLPEKCRPFLLPLLLNKHPIVEEDPVELLAKIFTFRNDIDTVKSIYNACNETLFNNVANKYPNILSPFKKCSFNTETLQEFNTLEKYVSKYSAVLTDEAFQLIPDHPWVSVLLWLVSKFPEIRKHIFQFKLNESQSRAFLTLAFEKPKIFEPILQALLYSEKLSICPGGRTNSSFGDFALFVWEGLAKQCPSCPKFEEKFKSVYQNHTVPKPIRHLNFPSAENNTTKIFGRTITWEGPKGKKGVKFRKLHESIQKLAAEPLAIKLYKEIDCQSSFPKPEGIFWVQHTPPWIREQLLGISPTESQVVCSFTEFPEGYYHYLNDSLHLEKKWREGRKRWLLDTAKGILVGNIKIDLASLFHNEKSGRKYQILADLIRPSNNRRNGAGRLSAPLTAVTFPNVSLSTGARDVGDFIPFSVLKRNKELESKDLKVLKKTKTVISI